MNIVKYYSLSNVNVKVECEDKLLSRKVIDAIDDYFLLTRYDSISYPPHITLNFNNTNSSFTTPGTTQALFNSSSLRVLKDKNLCYLLSENSFFQLELANSVGMGFIDFTFWEYPAKLKQEFLQLSLLWLLRKYGLYALHADGLVKDGLGILLVGSTRSSKSTTALSLIRQGWGYLSDDVILLKHDPDGIKAIAFLKGFSFDPILANHYPELNKPVKVQFLNGQKRFLNIDSIYPNKFSSSCDPKILIFPKIITQEKSQLIPIDKAKALILLIESSGGIMVDKEMVAKQIEVLKWLVFQTDSYELLAGRDLYEMPEKISDFLLDNIKTFMKIKQK